MNINHNNSDEQTDVKTKIRQVNTEYWEEFSRKMENGAKVNRHGINKDINNKTL